VQNRFKKGNSKGAFALHMSKAPPGGVLPICLHLHIIYATSTNKTSFFIGHQSTYSIWTSGNRTQKSCTNINYSKLIRIRVTCDVGRHSTYCHLCTLNETNSCTLCKIPIFLVLHCSRMVQRTLDISIQIHLNHCHPVRPYSWQLYSFPCWQFCLIYILHLTWWSSNVTFCDWRPAFLPNFAFASIAIC